MKYESVFPCADWGVVKSMGLATEIKEFSDPGTCTRGGWKSSQNLPRHLRPWQVCGLPRHLRPGQVCGWSTRLPTSADCLRIRISFCYRTVLKGNAASASP